MDRMAALGENTARTTWAHQAVEVAPHRPIAPTFLPVHPHRRQNMQLMIMATTFSTCHRSPKRCTLTMATTIHTQPAGTKLAITATQATPRTTTTRATFSTRRSWSLLHQRMQPRVVAMDQCIMGQTATATAVISMVPS